MDNEDDPVTDPDFDQRLDQRLRAFYRTHPSYRRYVDDLYERLGLPPFGTKWASVSSSPAGAKDPDAAQAGDD